MRFFTPPLFFLLIFLSAGVCTRLSAQNINWTSPETGLQVAQVKSEKSSPVGDRIVHIARVDPDYFDFKLLTVSEKGGKKRTAKQWVDEFELTAALNAGMFQMDHKTNVGYMKNYTHFNNSRFNKDNTIIAFNPKEDNLPKVQIIDRQCQDWESLAAQYNSLTQGIRMVDCNQKNKWSQQNRIWSMVIFGMDQSGHALLVFCRSPYSVHDFIDILLDLDLKLYNAMYLEGGPEASLVVSAGKTQWNLFGSYETGFFESDANTQAWPIPNIIGISKKQ